MIAEPDVVAEVPAPDVVAEVVAEVVESDVVADVVALVEPSEPTTEAEQPSAE